MIDYYSKPILTARETARYLGMPESTLDVWLLDRGKSPLVHAVQPERRGWPRVPFVGVIEAYVLRALRDLKLPMDEIRKAAELVRAGVRRPVRAGPSPHRHRRGGAVREDGRRVLRPCSGSSDRHLGCSGGAPEADRLGRRWQRKATPSAGLPGSCRRHHRPALRVGRARAGPVEGQGRGPRDAVAKRRAARRRSRTSMG